MKRTYWILFLLMIISFSSISQEVKKVYNDKQNMEVVLQQEAFYPSGEKALWKFFFKNMTYSQEAIDKKISGDVMVSFDVEIDSTITGVKVISGIGMGIDEEVVKLIKTLKYAPSIQNGVPLKMNVIVTIPVRARPKPTLE